MERNSSNILEIKKISQVIEDSLDFIVRRRDGLEPSLRVSSEKINNAFLDGFDWGRIVAVAGLSGTGKSTLVRQWLIEMSELNKNQEFEILSFQFEMMGIDEVARDAAGKIGKTIKQVYSSGKPLSNSELRNVQDKLNELSKYNINIVDRRGTAKQIRDTIIAFIRQTSCKRLVISIDNASLVARENNQDEKQTIDELMFTLIDLKKELGDLGIKVIIFLISQLNRNIEQGDRVTNQNLHYPNKTDLFGASSIYNGSDYVIITHKPCVIDGIGSYYGPKRNGWPKGLPVFNPDEPSQAMIYLHVIKERFGVPAILLMVDSLKFGRIEEYRKEKSE